MKRHILFIFVCSLCAGNVTAEEFTTFIHHKDGRVFAIASDQIDSITHNQPMDESCYDLTDSIVYPAHMNAMMGVLFQAAAGIPNSGLCSNNDMDALFPHNARYERTGEWTQQGMFTLIDDDTMDEFIPSSYAGHSMTDADKKTGGYFSLLYPFLKSLEVKHNVQLTCGLAAEGQRIGLTGFATNSDHCALNENGRLMQQLVTRAHWDCLCHSMTARLAPDESCYIVDSLNSRTAKNILIKGKWNGAYSIYTTGVYDRQTGKNYTISEDRTTWVETPTKYIQPYCYDRKTSNWVYNETFPVEYQLGEWKHRADSLGLIYSDIMVHWGNTTSAPLLHASRNYFSHSVDPTGLGNGVNNVPLSATVHRISTITTGVKNVYSKARYDLLKKAIDKTADTHGWLVLMSHFYDVNYYNGYIDGLTYPNKEDDYNPEWINPLVTEEIRSMNENNYWENPPARLGIKNWGEWRPAKGTQLWCLYQIFEYAIEKGLLNVSPSEGIKIIGNKVNIGTYRDHGLYPREKKMQLRPIDHCCFVVGADGSIKYESHK